MSTNKLGDKIDRGVSLIRCWVRLFLHGDRTDAEGTNTLCGKNVMCKGIIHA